MSSSKCLYSFNKELEGKNLVILEELQAGKENWGQIKDGIKNIVSNERLRIEPKGKDAYDITNLVNLIINTNNDAVGKIGINDRRLIALDINPKYMGNFTYFNQLASFTHDSDVAHAFFCLSKDVFDKNFKSNILPKTQSKKELTIESLPTILQFIKDEYLLNNLPINIKFNELYDKYTEWAKFGGHKYTNKVATTKTLRTYNIETKTGAHNILFVKATHAELLKLFQEKNWISELDQYDAKAPPKPNKIDAIDDLEPEAFNIEKILKNDKLCQKIIELYKKQQVEEKETKIEKVDYFNDDEKPKKSKKKKYDNYQMQAEGETLEDVLNKLFPK